MLPYKVCLKLGSAIDFSVPFFLILRSLVDHSVPGETSSESPEEAAVGGDGQARPAGDSGGGGG